MKRSPSVLVPYASSDEDEDAKREVKVVKKRKLPALSSSFAVPVPKDDPAMHQGRLRTQPHIEGQFAAYVYVPVHIESTSPLGQLLRDALRYAKCMVVGLHGLSGGMQTLMEDPTPGAEIHKTGRDSVDTLELHISLSRPLYLRAHQREELKRAVKCIARKRSAFKASFATFAELTNDERTRTFLAMEIGAGHHELASMCESLTPTLRSLRQNKFYDNPRFHASVAWALLAQDQPCDSHAPLINSEPVTESPLPAAGINSFPSIPHFPLDFIDLLNDKFRKRLLGSSAGVLDLEMVSVKIGKDISSFGLL